MAQLYRPFLLVLTLFCGLISASAQQQADKPISGDFTNLRFEQFAKQIESQTPYCFFYNPSDIDSLIVNVQATNQPLRAILRQLFEGSKYFFAIDQNQRVYITFDRPIQTELPVGYFRGGSGSTENDSTMNAYLRLGKAKRVETETKVYDIGKRTNPIRPGRSTIAGSVRSISSGEPIVGAAIYVENPRIGTVTDQFGYYSITLPRGRYDLKLRSIGQKDTRRRVILYADGKLDIEMEDDVIALKEVVIEAEKDVNVSGMQMGQQRVDIKTIRQVPTALGEADLLRVILTLPGVKSVGESSTGLNVRGGSTDQNLILYNDAPIYNSSHLFGFFSAFNPDIIKSAELYKSGIPSRFGGRLSSVLDVQTRDGNKKKLVGSGGIGLLTGRLTLEGPLLKDKTSFIIGGRSTYSDWLLRQLPNSSFKNSQASFYDLNLHVTHDFNEKNTLYLTGYLSQDRFRLNSDTTYQYQNQTATLKWKHIINNKLYSVFTGSYSGYKYNVYSEKNPINAYQLDFAINQSQVKADFNYYPSNRHAVDYGISSTYYKLSPGNFRPRGSESLIVPDLVSGEQGLENAVYIGDKFDITDQLSISGGLRYSAYTYLGPKSVFQYAPGQARTENTIIDTVSYATNQAIQTYHGPEYRLALRYALSSTASIKASFNRMRQYIQMLSNTTVISPTDIWKLSDPNIKPQIGDQYALGFYRNNRTNTIETSVEVYYKNIQNLLDYRSGAILLLNHHIETDVVNAQGKAYGIEFLIKKSTGKLNGWLSYTYARTLLRTNSPNSAETINQGSYYPSNYDKPHDVTMIGNYKINRRFSLSLNFTYSTGRPITLPVSKYTLDGAQRLFYSERNQYRVPDYYRADFAMNIEGNHKIKKLAHSSWTIAVYNLTGRRNVYSVYFKSENGVINGYKLSIFGQPIPSVTYNFRF
ncbi:TonB-dependent receptor [Spirosoma endbachense]|uniref:TonB-dependent receptor plug domain-containing protein n=1 Tax=Spirosoma endbachense TaxID=2666025 RepID=A0A6P1W3U8_9BACT|nr:TonB-dependent receptor [Spirosoma endbachense]QHV99574.1 TonB-dependent receptor plug domain-containing protein [Spirosoma endbachense]